MRIPPLLFILLFAQQSFAQTFPSKKDYSGVLSLGVRNTFSTFNDGVWKNLGMGVGGQFRLQFANRVNSDWFYDYIRSNAGEYAQRTDQHIGWSVLFYPYMKKDGKPSFVQPYILAGHCFDYTRLSENNNESNHTERWSTAVQGGIGTHVNLSTRADVSVVAQYMMHLGTDIHVHEDNGVVTFEEHSEVSAEGHLLFNLSLNYKIADLW